MCAILDNDVVHQVFISDDCLKSGSDNRPEAGKAFFDWIDSGKGNLVIGGELRRELEKTRSFRNWLQVHILSGRIHQEDDQEVDGRAQTLKETKSCQSNDTHVIALAQISGARLLYSNDGRLSSDFKDKKLINNPQGKVYTTRKHANAPPAQDNTKLRSTHSRLLTRNVCQRPD